jgi:hypothetical protein
MPRSSWLSSSIGLASVSLPGKSRSKMVNRSLPGTVRLRVCGYRHRLEDWNRTRRDAVTFFAQDSHGGRFPLMILDWDIVQIQGALLETWLPTIFERLEELSKICRARYGSIGALIEDKTSGTILLQQALRRQMPVRSTQS